MNQNRWKKLGDFLLGKGFYIVLFLCVAAMGISGYYLIRSVSGSGKIDDQAVTGNPMEKYYRPPRGVYSEDNLRMASEMGYTTLFWSLAYVDWYVDDQPTAEEAFSKLLPRIHPGAVVLLHTTSSTNAAILDELLTRWEEMGYAFASIRDIA